MPIIVAPKVKRIRRDEDGTNKVIVAGKTIVAKPNPAQGIRILYRYSFIVTSGKTSHRILKHAYWLIIVRISITTYTTVGGQFKYKRRIDMGTMLVIIIAVQILILFTCPVAAITFVIGGFKLLIHFMVRIQQANDAAYSGEESFPNQRESNPLISKIIGTANNACKRKHIFDMLYINLFVREYSPQEYDCIIWGRNETEKLFDIWSTAFATWFATPCAAFKTGPPK